MFHWMHTYQPIFSPFFPPPLKSLGFSAYVSHCYTLAGLKFEGHVKAHSIIATAYLLQEVGSGWYQQMRYAHWDTQFPPLISIMLSSYRSRARVSANHVAKAVFHRGKGIFQALSVILVL